MRRLYILVPVILLGIILVTGLILLSGSTTFPPARLPASDKPERTVTIPSSWSFPGTPTMVTVHTSPKPTALSSTPLAVGTGSGDVYPYPLSLTALEQRVHERINKERTDKGLGALISDPDLAGIARRHSEDMALQKYFAHVNPAGQNPTARGAAVGYLCKKNYGSYYTYGIAENIFLNNLYSAATFYSNRETVYHWNTPETIAEITVGGWMNSSGHRENILTPTFDRQGIGIAVASEKVYITENFC